jgi:hypothetical protein
MFAPHLTKELVQEGLATQSSAEFERLVEAIELPTL